jgi:hypothetical protein
LASISTVRKLSLAVQVLGRHAGKTRLGGALLSGLTATAQSFSRILHILWLEVTGFVFLALAVIGGGALAREYSKYQAGTQGPGRLIMAICFCLVFGYFGLSSFWRARKKN